MYFVVRKKNCIVIQYEACGLAESERAIQLVLIDSPSAQNL